jgi:rod shape-determining protein MreC
MYRRAGRGRVLLVIFLGVCIALITLDYRSGEGGPLDKAREISSTIVDPIQRGFTTVFRPVGDFFSSLGELGSLRSENARLKEQVQENTELIGVANAVRDENAELRRLHELDESWASMERVTAEVIFKHPSNYKWIVTIDKGEADGIQPDMAVINADGLVGKILRVNDNSADVLLLIDPDGSAAAKVTGCECLGSLTGNGIGEQLSMSYVGTKAEIDVEDEVLTSSYNGGIFPANIPIGLVTYASAEQAAPEQEIEVEPFVDFQSLEFVQVLLESGPELEQVEPRDNNEDQQSDRS